MTGLISTLTAFYKPKNNIEELHREKCTFFFFSHLTQNQVSDRLHSGARNKSGEHGPPRLPEVVCKAKEASLLTPAQTCADTDGDRPEGPGSHKTAVVHHEWLAGHARATGHGPLGKGFPRSCQCFRLSCDESVAHRVHPGVTLCPQNTGAAFCSRPPHVLKKQELGSLPAQATLQGPQTGASMMRCRNVSQAGRLYIFSAVPFCRLL